MDPIDRDGEKVLKECMRGFYEAKDRAIFEQLSGLVTQGLLEVVETQPVMVQDLDMATGRKKLRMEQAVKLRLRDQDVIDELRARCEKAENLVAELKKLFSSYIA